MKGKHILLGVTGGIAAYKTAHLIRLLVKEGAEVKVVMTPLAKQFITPLTLATLSKNPILVDFFDPENGQWNSHVDLGLWADAYVIAPATANTMGKMANGIADNLLVTSYLSARCPIFIAPAMDLDMYQHPTTLKNIETLKGFGAHVVEAESGELASGLHGKGRMAEPEHILEALVSYFSVEKPLEGKKVLLTAGPTQEPIDPVRFIGNHSSGKMGYAIAEELAEQGAEVHIVSGPVTINAEHENITVEKVKTAEEMYNACTASFQEYDIAVLAAAVADFTPVVVEDKKVKRGKENYTVELQPTKDIAAELGKRKSGKQLLVGFALETHDAESNALSKLERKQLDCIVLNSMEDKGAGFQHDTNKVSILKKDGSIKRYELKPKTEVAKDIVNSLTELLP